MTKQTKKLIAIFIVMAITMFVAIKASAEITKVQELNGGCSLYYSTQLNSIVEVVDSKESIKSLMEMMEDTDCKYYKEYLQGLPCEKKTKLLKVTDLKEDAQKLLDIGCAYYTINSYWAGRKGGGRVECLVWKEEERVYYYTVQYKDEERYF